jgi:inositol polyphosphate-4-phosphatase
VTFALERAQAPVSANEDVFVPTISGDRTEFVVTVPLPDAMFDRLRLDGVSKRFVRVVPVMFTIGINEQATLAERFGDVSLQETLNQDNYHRLHAYFEKYNEFVKLSESTDAPSSPSSSSASLNLENQMRHLHMSVLAKRNKNVDVLHQAAEICRALHGVRFTSCKSAKDRTAMAVTLEQVQLLSRENDLGADVFFHALGSFRSEGVRRENTVKNSGVRKYAFNSIQLLSLPKLYRPPNGTYGNYET